MTYRGVDQYGLVRVGEYNKSIRDYMVSASAPHTPYLLSTSDRYVKLKSNRDEVINRVTRNNSMMPIALSALAAKVRKEENKKLSTLAATLGIGVADIATIFDSVKVINEKSINEAVTAAVRPIENFLVNYAENDLRYVESVIFASLGTGEVSPTSTIFSNRTPNSIQKEIEELMESFALIEQIMGSAEVWDRGSSRLINELKRFKDLSNKAKKTSSEAIAKIINTAGRDGDKSHSTNAIKESENIFKGKFNQNQVTRQLMSLTSLVTAELIYKALSNLHKPKSVDVEKIDKAVDRAAVDSVLSYFNNQIMRPVNVSIAGMANNDLSVNVNWSRKTRLTHKDNTMVLDFDVNFGELMLNYIRSNLTDGIDLFYRSMILNMAAIEGYPLSSKEREVLFRRELSKDWMLKSSFGEGDFPLFVSVRGKTMLFSELLMKMSVGKVEILPFRGRPPQMRYRKSINHSELYMKKLIVTRGKRRKSFVNIIGIENLVNDIENSYKNMKSSKASLRFDLKI